MLMPDNEQAAALDGALVDLLDLALLARHAHWNVVGPRFGALHPLLDELADLARRSADVVAERAITLGHSPDGRASTITTFSSLPSVDHGVLRDADVITAFVAILDAVADRLHDALEAFDKDVVTVGVFAEVLADVEKSAWMLRAQSDL